MRTQGRAWLVATLSMVVIAPWGLAQSPEVKAKIEAKARLLQALGSDPKVVEAVKARNAAPPADVASMTNEKWKALSQLDPLVRGFSKNATAVYLKTRMDAAVSEWFLCGSDGTKVAFLAKPSNWSHKGKEKHQVPMSGKVFYGPLEVDESSGQQQIQVGIPVLDGGRPVGSLVVGLAVAKLQ